MTTPDPAMRSLSERAAAGRSYAAIERRLVAYADRHTLSSDRADRLIELIQRCREPDPQT